MKTFIANNYLMLPTDKGLRMIDPALIVRVQAVSNYSKLYFSDGRTLVVAKVLRWFELNVALYNFIRIHRGHLINRTFINDYIEGQRGSVQLLNGEQVYMDAHHALKTVEIIEKIYNAAKFKD